MLSTGLFSAPLTLARFADQEEDLQKAEKTQEMQSSRIAELEQEVRGMFS